MIPTPRRAILVILLTTPLVSQERPLWGELEPGPYPVGFHARWEFDRSRTYDIDLDGQAYAAGRKRPRPILVNTWYPAESEPDAVTMTHGEYLDLPAGDEALGRLALALSEYAHGVIVEWVLRSTPETMSEWDRVELARLLAHPTAAVRDADPAPGKFPLLVYHAGYGSSYEDNAVFCEYLASHGYVVAGSAFLSEKGGSFNIDGKAGSARDFGFLVAKMAEESNVDWEHVGVAGHSGGAHAALTFQAQPMAAVDAVISLDTTQDYVSALDPHWMHTAVMLETIEYQTAPVLAVAQPHAFFQACDALIRAERYYLTFRDLEHNDYTSQGVIAAEVAARRAAATEEADVLERAEYARAARRGFEQCSEYSKWFLDAYLKEDAVARQKLDTLYRNAPLMGADPRVQYAPVGAGAPQSYDDASGIPPTPRELIGLLEQDGAPAALEVLERFHEQAPGAAIYHSQFAYAVLYDRVARGHVEQAEQLAPFFASLHTDLAANYLWWIDRAQGKRYEEFHEHALRAASLVAPEDEQVRERLEQWRAARDE